MSAAWRFSRLLPGHPADCGAGAEVQAIGKDGGGQLGGEVDEGGPASGHGPDSEGTQALAEPEPGAVG